MFSSRKLIRTLRSLTDRLSLELLFWTGGLIYLFLLNMNPGIGAPDLCLSRISGLGDCPGCGLGESLSYLLRGHFGAALEAHVLGPFALTVILVRITTLIKSWTTITRKEYSHGKTDAAAS